jgi:hypothetical protein
MKTLLILAGLLVPSLIWANDNDWQISGSFRQGVGNGEVVLAIAGHDVAVSPFGGQATLRGQYQGRDIIVRCDTQPYTTLVACAVSADGQLLKTVYFDSRSLR